jgi:hypothetical protein
MSRDETDLAILGEQIAAVRERVMEREEARAQAAAWALRTAGALRDAAEADGMTGTGLHAMQFYGCDFASFWAHDPEAGRRAQVCVIPDGWTPVLTEAIHECREHLASELLARIRKADAPDGTQAAAVVEIVAAWALNHGAI